MGAVAADGRAAVTARPVPGHVDEHQDAAFAFADPQQAEPAIADDGEQAQCRVGAEDTGWRGVRRRDVQVPAGAVVIGEVGRGTGLGEQLVQHGDRAGGLLERQPEPRAERVDVGQVLIGADDGVAPPPPSPGAGFASLRDVVVIQGAGHFPHRERPAETAEAILAALGDLRGPAALTEGTGPFRTDKAGAAGLKPGTASYSDAAVMSRTDSVP